MSTYKKSEDIGNDDEKLHVGKNLRGLDKANNRNTDFCFEKKVSTRILYTKIY